MHIDANRRSLYILAFFTHFADCYQINAILCTHVVSMDVMLNALNAALQLLMLRREDDVPQGAVLVDNLLHHMTGWHLYGHRNWR